MTTSVESRTERYVDAAVRRELEELANTASGRNAALNKAAFVIGRFVGAGAITEDEAVTGLVDACERNGYARKDGWSAVRASLRSGLRNGAKSPRTDLPRDEPRWSTRSVLRATPLTVDALAEAKLPSAAPFLRQLGLRDTPRGVEMPYVLRDGSIYAVKLRRGLSGHDSLWPEGVTTVAYEPDRGALAREEGYVIVVEGESDTWTLLFSGYPALGIPGAALAKRIQNEHLENVSHVFVAVDVDERGQPDGGGKTFPPGVRKRLAELEFKGQVHDLYMPDGAGDASDLYLKDPARFGERLNGALRSAMDGAKPAPIAEVDARPHGQRSGRTPALPKNPELPVIQVTPQLHDVVDASSRVLASDPNIYQQSGRLVRIVTVADAERARERVSAGTPQVRGVALPTLRERLAAVATFQRRDGRSDDWRDCHPPENVISALLERGEWPGVRPLVSIIETPSMRPDGSLIDEPGYDTATGYVYQPCRPYPPLPQNPTLEDARHALRALLEPWADFPFGSPAERYVPVAALMTLVARPAIRGACPAMVTDASCRGSGKTLQARAISTLAHGREAALVTWPGDPAELEKLLAGYALRGAGVIAIDNITGDFGGAALDKVLTAADRVELRILGRTEVPAVHWRAVILANGNNIVMGGDTSRRVLVARLEPMAERPEERSGYAIADLIEWCREHHPRLVCAALTVLRAYVLAGRPAQNLAGWGSYEAWRDLIGSAIVWAGGEDVMTCRPTIAGRDDPELAALRVVMEHLSSLAPDGISCAAMISALYPAERMRGNAPPDGYEPLREALEALAPPKQGSPPSAQKLGYSFRAARRRVVAGRYLDHAPAMERSGVARWIIREAGR